MSYTGIWDGFDDWNLTKTLWDSIGGIPAFSSTYARFPAAPNCVAQGVQFGYQATMTKNYKSNVTTPIASFAVYFVALPTSGHAAFIGFLDNGTFQCVLCVNAAGGLEARSGPGAALFGTSPPGLITAGVYYFIDVIVGMSTSAGTFNVYLSTPAGGGALFALSGLNTAPDGNAYANQVCIGDSNQVGLGIRMDDFHAHDAASSVPNTVLGEGTRIYTKLPNGAGALSQLTPTGASANWQCVDEQIPDDDTTYVLASSFPEQDVYAVGAAGFTGTVNGIVRRGRIRKDDAGAHTFEEGIGSSGVYSFGSAVAVPSSYAYTDYFTAIDPNTSAAWTVAAADAASPTIKAVS